GLNRVRGNQALYNKMLQMFQNSEEFAKLDGFLAEKDYQKAGEVAHAIKGMSGNLSLTAVFEHSATLMQELYAGAPNEATLQQYRDALEHTMSEIRDMIG
ncbi:Hpt domain-containing protein, partial [Clostridia bacterium OttesenSCG-928-F22]|nr:Hpt domain-containing protein [Clostridia bacterium OttesenSCG-928-F22]